MCRPALIVLNGSELADAVPVTHSFEYVVLPRLFASHLFDQFPVLVKGDSD